jgi:hypothetical protein
VGEPGGRVRGGDRVDCQTHRLLERLARTRAQAAQDGLALGERLLDGVESGEEGGRKRSEQPRAERTSWRLAALWALRWSSTTTCPGRSVGANCSVMSHAKVARSIAPAIGQGSRKPAGVSAATNVVLRHGYRTLQTRSALGRRVHRRHQSTSRLMGSVPSHGGRSGTRAPGDQVSDGTPERGSARPFTCCLPIAPA